MSVSRLVLVAIIFAMPAPALADCVLTLAFTRPDERGTRQVKVFEAPAEAGLGGARPLLFVSSLKVNTDGTSRSYNARDPRARTVAINDMRNAMRGGRTIAEFEAVAAANWQPLDRTWSIVSGNVIEKSRATGAPCVDSGGFMVSMTSDVAVDGGFNKVGDCDQSKWIDALVVPALVLPGGATQFKARGAGTRSPVVAMTLGPARNLALGIVGDHGPADELGEASVEMNRMLNGLPAGAQPTNAADAIARFQGPRSIVMVFPGAANRIARPITAATTAAAVKARFDAWGGKARLEQCAAALPAG